MITTRIRSLGSLGSRRWQVEIALGNTHIDEASRQDAEWDVINAPSNYLGLVSSQVIASILSLASVWLVTRYLGAGGYGAVVAIIAAAQVVMLLSINWTSLSVARYGCEEFVQTGRIASAFWARLGVLFPNLVLLVATTPLWLPLLSEVLNLQPGSAWLVLGLILAYACWTHVQQALHGVKLLRLQGWLLALERLLVFVALFTLAFRGWISVWTVCGVYVLGSLAASLTGLLRLRRLIWPIGFLDVPLLKRMLRFSLPIIPAAFIGYLSTYYLDVLFISHFLSQVELGIYAVAFQLSGLTQQLPVLAGTLLMPLFVTLQTDEQETRTKSFMTELLPIVTLLWTLACALVAGVGWYGLPLLFGARFQQIGELLWPLMMSSAFVGPWLMGYGPIATSASKTSLIMIAVTSGSFANISLNWILIPRFGLLGCAWATGVSSAVSLIMIYFLAHRHLGLKHTWTLQATLPLLLGASYATVFGGNLGACGVTLGSGAMIFLIHRKSILEAIRTVAEYAQVRFLRSRITIQETSSQ